MGLLYYRHRSEYLEKLDVNIHLNVHLLNWTCTWLHLYTLFPICRLHSVCISTIFNPYTLPDPSKDPCLMKCFHHWSENYDSPSLWLSSTHKLGLPVVHRMQEHQESYDHDPTQTVNLLKTLWYGYVGFFVCFLRFFFFCNSVVSWALQITTLCLNEVKSLDTPESFYST